MMMNNSLDRFSSPLETERVNIHWMKQAHEQQQELNKKHIVNTFISKYWDEYALVPDTETIQEVLYHIDLDEDMVNDCRRNF
jgi:hypothetical protein